EDKGERTKDNNIHAKFSISTVRLAPQRGRRRRRRNRDVDANGILNVAAANKTASPSNSNHITNANDEGRLSQEAIGGMVAEEYR
ncbi:hypothetical protein AURDEDRAFT_40421, partial [Auricularia subglabra TFB-10046 SS5]